MTTPSQHITWTAAATLLLTLAPGFPGSHGLPGPPASSATPGSPRLPGHTPLLQHAAAAQTFNVDAMVGQVNGRAIYVKDVLDERLDKTLWQWGRELPINTFRNRAAERIALRLNGIVADALIFGEAQRDLSDPERQGLLVAVTKQREKLLREYGQGSPALAEAKLIEETGMDLEQTLERWRQAMIVQRYMHQKLRPKVNVTRKDVKRFYNEHQDQFNPPPSRTVRVIQTESSGDAQAIREMLDNGTPFKNAAKDDRNTFRKDTGGLMGDMPGEQLFANPDVNTATLELKEGQCVGPIDADGKQWFVCVEKITQEPGQSLMDVQGQIYATLYEQQLRALTEKYREELFESGSYNSIEQMTLSVLEIAVDRYARAQAAN